MAKVSPYLKVYLILVITGLQVRPYSLWFEVKTAGREADGIGVSGPNLDVIVNGAQSYMDIYWVDWKTGTFNRFKIIKTFNLGGNRYTIADHYNAVVISKAVVRATTDPSGPTSFELLTMPNNKPHFPPHLARGTAYVFSGGSWVDGSDFKLYRFRTDTTTELLKFGLSAKTETYGVLFGTNLVVASLFQSNERKVFDYTRGYDGGPAPGPVTTHIKPSGPNEETAFVSPQDGRGYYVVATNSGGDPQGIATVKDVGGSQKLAYTLNTVRGDPQALSWVADTDYVAGSTWNDHFFIANFMDETKSSELIVGLFPNAYKKSRGSFVWEDKKVFAVHVNGANSVYIYKILEEMPCSELCLTCDDIWRKKCLTCQPNSSLTAGSGSPPCSCDPNYYEVPNGYTIKKCLQCHAPLCGTCSSGAQDACLTCLWMGGFVDSGVCKTCDINDSPECPSATSIEIGSSLQELSRNFVMKFVPSLKSSIPAEIQYSAKTLTENQFTFRFKRKGKDETPLTVINQTLTHQDDASFLKIEYLEKMRFEDTEHIKIAVKDPWVARSKTSDPVQHVTYFKQQEKIIKIEKKQETAQKKDEERSAQVGQVTRAVVGATVGAAVGAAAVGATVGAVAGAAGGAAASSSAFSAGVSGQGARQST